jgi:hypothetical protein|tara:strand:- start:4 stop:357 length:354 start_codon:yes stop_codon:yes gene_type:complete
VRIKLETLAGKEAIFIASECVSLLDAKQKDYGPRNISRFGVRGLAVRLYDKVERLAHLLMDKDSEPANESVEDTFKDIANYGLIGLMLLRDKWPADEPEDAQPFYGIVGTDTETHTQ